MSFAYSAIQNIKTSKRTITCLSVLLIVSLFFEGVLSLSANADPPDLSKLTADEKSQGYGQFQTAEPAKNPSPNPPQNPEDHPDEVRRRRAEEDRRRREQDRRNRQTMLGVGAGGATVGGIAASNRYFNNARSDATFDEPPLSNDLTYPWLSPSDGLNSGEDSADAIDAPSTRARVVESTGGLPMNFNTKNDHSVAAAVNSLYFRDLSRLNEPIVNGINSSQLGWAGAPGIEGSFAWQPESEEDYGFSLGFALADGHDEVNVSAVDRLFTTPSVGFVSSPFRSQRDTSLATVEGNLLIGGAIGKGAIGVRWLHLEDSLENQVLPAGLTHRIRTNSDSLLAQYMIQPTVEWKRARFESLLQVGVGAFWGKSNTQFERVVGGPSNVPNDIEAGRMSGTLFFKGQVGVAVPIQKWFAFRGGLQLLAQTDTAQAAGQIASTDIVQQKYHLRTESLVLGGLFAGIELRR